MSEHDQSPEPGPPKAVPPEASPPEASPPEAVPTEPSSAGPGSTQPRATSGASLADPSLEAVGVGSVELIAAAIRADFADLETFERVFAGSIASLLPAGMLEIDYERSLSDRVKGRPGKVVGIKIVLGEQTLALTSERAGLAASVSRHVRGVAISSRQVGLDEWTQALALGLQQLAEQNAAARVALSRLLGTS